MADKGLFSRLQKLFSTDVIIRNVGGKTLKVGDVNRLQSYGSLETNRLMDRFTRLYSPVASWAYNPTLNYQTLRYQLYSDYEAMDTDAIIASSLDILSEEATLKDEYGNVLTINTDDDNIKKVLNNLFYDILNIEFNLPTWVRNMCKYGDFYLKLEISEKFGVYKVIPFSTYQVVRIEGQDPENPDKIQFKLEQSSGYNIQYPHSNENKDDAVYFENYEMAHFRLLTDANYLPYGRSYLEPARKLFKQYTLMEDAALIHRIMRAPEKRTFYINVGSIPPNEVDAFMEKTVSSIKKTPYVDQNTGEYNLKFNMQNMLEDFYIPIRGNDAATKIDTTKGLEYDGMADVEYYRDKLFAALRVPKAFLGYDENLDGKATLAAEDIRFARTIEKIQRIIVSELYKIAFVHLYTQGYDDERLVNFELNLTTPSIIFEQEKTELYKSKVDLANSILEGSLLSKDWVYKNIFKLSNKEFKTEQEEALEDAKFKFRLNQVENEGNDPLASGESFGTPHDLASLYSTKRDKSVLNVPDGYEEEDQGRPQTKLSQYKTNSSTFGKDPLGQDSMKSNDSLKVSDTNDVRRFQEGQLFRHKNVLDSLKKRKPTLLKENEGLLDERQITGLD
tara:strand:+ start:3166 stop:5019 length:1854 start_codon:yes stop_codon:yes gene_type:complete